MSVPTEEEGHAVPPSFPCGAQRTFLLQTLGAAYTPISIDRHGRLFSLNGGDLFVIDGGHDHD